VHHHRHHGLLLLRRRHGRRGPTCRSRANHTARNLER
jgi:hypothetical protein